MVESILMRPPIVLSESGDIEIFKDIDALLRYVEPIDVANGEYVAYDSEGRCIHLASEKIVKRRLFGLLRDEFFTPVTARADDEAPHSKELRSLLLDALTAVDPLLAETKHESPLQEVLETAALKLGYTT